MRSRIAVRLIGLGIAAVVTSAALVACGGDDETTTESGAGAGADLPQGSEPVKLDPAEFTTEIDNPYWPMKPGSRWIYREFDSEGTEQKVVVTVTERTKRIANGVEARVVRDVVTENGVPVEVTDDWYAQDSAGNIWYLGEATTEYEDGKPTTTAGSFEAGVDGAQPGIILPGRSGAGDDLPPGVLQGRGGGRGRDRPGRGPGRGAGRALHRCADDPDTNPLEPKVLEFKFYAPHVGPVLAVGVSGGSDREELLSYTR